MTLYVLLYICKGKAFSYKIRIELKFEKKYTTLLLYNHMIDNCFFLYLLDRLQLFTSVPEQDSLSEADT